MALGSTQPLVKMSTRKIPGGKGGRCVRLTSSPPSRAECHEIWEPKPLEPPGPHRTCYGTALPLPLPYYDFVMNAWNIYMFSKGLFEECDKKENVAVTGAATASCFKRRL